MIDADKLESMALRNRQRAAAIAEANKVLTAAGERTIGQMLGKQAEAVQAAMRPVLQVSVRSVYGAPAIYPANEAAKVFAEIANTKTLQFKTLASAKKLGYRIEQVPDPVSQLILLPGLQDLVLEA